MVFSKTLKIITFVPRKIFNYTNNINKALEAPTAIGNKMSDFEKWITKLFGTTTSSGLLARGSVDAAEAYACNDGVCFYVSCVGMMFDALGMVANFVPGPNITQVITLPGSTFCKVFVLNCKNKTLPWKGGCK